MADPNTAIDTITGAWLAAGTGGGTFIAILVAYIKERKAKPEGELAITSASFSDRPLITRLHEAVEANTIATRASTTVLEEIAQHLRAEAQSRHDDAIRRAALLEARGLVDKA